MDNLEYKICVGTTTGPYHIKNNLPNQDYCNYYIDDNIAIYALADGAGSLEKSELGAKIVVDESIENLKEKLKEIDFNSSLDEAKSVIKDNFYHCKEVLKQNDSDNYKQYGCTLSVIVIKDNVWCAGSVGDSFIIVKFQNNNENDSSYEIITTEVENEYINITQLITSTNFDIAIKSGINPLMIAVCSDGLQYVSLKENKPFENFWNPIYNLVLNDELNIDELFSNMENQGRLDDDTTMMVSVKSMEES